jgi:hypothetical protein
MAKVIRLILLFILFLTSQSGIAATTEFTVHQYDVNHIAQSDEIYGYDTNINLRHCCHILLTPNTQDWSFLAFVSDFLAIKRGTPGSYRPDRTLPRDKHGNPVPDTNAPHTQLGTKRGRNGDYTQAREFDGNGKPVRDIDFTDHGRPQNHPNPHQHRYVPNETGGTLRRLKDAEPL